MKKIIALILSALLVCSAASCSGGNSSSKAESKIEAATEQKTEAPTEAPTNDPEIQAALDKMAEDYEFEGVVYAVKDGTQVASYAKGKLENGDEITLESPMPVGSVSKQFCAAAVLLLQEQGKLSVDDTLDKYFSEYKNGKKITIKNLLSMRSGIPEMTEEGNENLVSNDKTEKENVDAIKKLVFSQELDHDPDTIFAYANVNYFLLSNIVEQVSGEKYVDFLRKSFFTPLNMNHTGTIGELPSNPDWAKGLDYKKVDTQPGLTNGCGDIISNAHDMTVWINALSSGKAISKDSYKAMTTDYSPETHYGYGMFLDISGGVGHYGSIGIYSAFDYINEEKKFTLFVDSNTLEQPTEINSVVDELLKALMK